ncbi:hypothetical protein DFP72DRAFT_1173267 [Ephemerocybe angulata]|uniref:Uncharacterized protein n=1 Tax=Ephemerocybe angulata TaxID=980116 RepID=A0A8H6HMW0_9AGAR|nr:hypothetical protein DFP72DRAFT_1173267 [Tulosesus angulatus]
MSGPPGDSSSHSSTSTPESSSLRFNQKAYYSTGSSHNQPFGDMHADTINAQFHLTHIHGSPGTPTPAAEEPEDLTPPITMGETYKGVSAPLEDKLSKAIQGFMSNAHSRLMPPTSPGTSTENGTNGA